jgi:hypothetical protein
LNYAQQAGPAAAALDDQGIYTTAAIMQAMKGFRAGTAAQAVQRQFSGGVMTASKLHASGRSFYDSDSISAGFDAEEHILDLVLGDTKIES